jgi:hypothetical protein
VVGDRADFFVSHAGADRATYRLPWIKKAALRCTRARRDQLLLISVEQISTEQMSYTL